MWTGVYCRAYSAMSTFRLVVLTLRFRSLFCSCNRRYKLSVSKVFSVDVEMWTLDVETGGLRRAGHPTPDSSQLL